MWACSTASQAGSGTHSRSVRAHPARSRMAVPVPTWPFSSYQHRSHFPARRRFFALLRSTIVDRRELRRDAHQTAHRPDPRGLLDRPRGPVGRNPVGGGATRLPARTGRALAAGRRPARLSALGALRLVLETEITRDRPQNPAQLVSIAGRLDQAGELQRKLVQPHRSSSRPWAASQAAVDPAAVLSPCFGPDDGSSRRPPASETLDKPQHIRRCPGIKGVPLPWRGLA